MRKRLKKKLWNRKVKVFIKPGISQDPDECPEYIHYSLKSALDSLDALHRRYPSDFTWIKIEHPWSKYLSKTKQEQISIGVYI